MVHRKATDDYASSTLGPTCLNSELRNAERLFPHPISALANEYRARHTQFHLTRPMTSSYYDIDAILTDAQVSAPST